MGLNPPFGVNAALANKFIDKALEFNPKLLILIVPTETERCAHSCYSFIPPPPSLSLCVCARACVCHFTLPLAFSRLDKKRTPYDLVWEDKAMLAGKVK